MTNLPAVGIRVAAKMPRDNRDMVDWPHAPLHRFSPYGLFFVTGATYLKQHYYRSRAALDGLQDHLFGLAKDFGVLLQAWCLLSNHYHLVAEAEGPRLRDMISKLHSMQAHALNKRDGLAGRKVWFQFRDTELTYEKSWMARLRYTHENAVHHGLVLSATNYPWCSASWFQRTAPRGFAASVSRFPIGRIQVPDDFEVVTTE